LETFYPKINDVAEKQERAKMSFQRR